MVEIKDKKIDAGEASIKRFLLEINKETVKVCVWKSSDRWDEGIAGTTDVDLLVAPDFFEIAVKNLRDNRWFQVTAEPWRRFDGVVDLVSYQSGFTQHLHLHNRIVSGEKLVKSFSPDFTSLYLTSAQKQGYPYFVKPELEFITFILRMSLKLGWRDFGRIIKRRNKDAFMKLFIGEYKELKARIDQVELENVLRKPVFSPIPSQIILKAYEDLSTIGFSDIWKVRRSINQWRSITGFKLITRTIMRAVMKKFLNVGKPLTLGGISIAVCGADGSGKTTLVSALNTELKKQVKVRSYYLGGSARKSSFIRSCFRMNTLPFYLIVRKFFKIIGNRSAANFTDNFYTKIDGYMMDRDKRKRLKMGQNNVQEGGITIYDRFPLFSPYGDGLSVGRRIGKSYEPDIIALIEVSSSVAKERRPYDSKERLIQKVTAFNDFGSEKGPYREKILRLDANNTTESNVYLILQHLNNVIFMNDEQANQIKLPQGDL